MVESDRVARDFVQAINVALRGLMQPIVGGAGAMWRSLSGVFLLLCGRSRSFRATLHAMLRNEIGMAHKGWSGLDFELSSALGAQLSYTCMMRNGGVSYFRSLAKRALENVDVSAATRELLAALRDAVTSQQCRVYDVLCTLLSDAELDGAVIWDWFAVLLEVNEIRVASQQSRDHMSADMQQFSSSASFLCNLGAVMLRLVEPHVRGALAGDVDETLRTLDDNYASAGTRFGLAHFAPLRSATDSTTPLFPDATPPPAAATPTAPDAAMTERFFAATRAVHVCVVPALVRREQLLFRLRQLTTDPTPTDFVSKELQRSNIAYITELELSHSVVVGADGFLMTTLALATTTLLWLANRRAPALFGALPAGTVTDACRVLMHVLRCARDLLSAHASALLPRVATQLLASPSLVAHPPTRATLSDLLLMLLTPGQPSERAFLDDALVVERLVRALGDAYVAVGIVEGLDVDKQAFDKYSARQGIAEAMLEALRFAPHRAQLSAWCSAPTDAALEALIDTVLNDVLHLVDDALQRIVNVRQLELAEADRATWSLQSSETIQRRRRYADGESMVARGFLGMATSMLCVLAVLAREAPASFARPRLLPKTTSLLLRFMAQLCVPERVAQLAVQHPERCGFEPAKLMQLLIGVASSLGKLEQFVAAFQRDYSFEPEIMQHVLAYAVVHAMDRDDDGLKAYTKSVVAVTAAAATTTTVSSGTTNFSQLTSEELVDLQRRYLAALNDRRFDSYAMREGDSYAHHFATRIADAAPGAARLARIMQECESLTGDTLPLTLQSGVFVRVDEERIDVMKALIIGADGTPYSGGAFEFDVFLPSDYPTVPPLVNLETTGNGTVRFNPNLYNCGKVCLSILGTWHGGGDSTSKWNASHSTIQQVLVSIQGLILIEKPFFNEPAYELAANTREGERASLNYNEQLRLSTARHAILDPLRRINGDGVASPAHAFDESVLKPHFRLQRPRLLAQLARWRDEASEANRVKFAGVLNEIVIELDKLGNDDVSNDEK